MLERDVDYGRQEWARFADRPAQDLAVVTPEREVTVGELVCRAREVAGQFRANGLGAGDRVLVALTNAEPFVVAYLATRLCGAVVVNVPWQARREIVTIADAVDARIVIVEEDLVGDDEALGPLGRRRFRVGASAERGPTEPVGRAPDDVAWLACTSGTTGRPKVAVHTERTLHLQTSVFAEAYGLTSTDPVLVPAPVGHAVGFLFGVRQSLATGNPMVLLPRWRADIAATMVRRYGCAFAAAPTPFVSDVVGYAEEQGADAFASLRYFPSGGAPVPRPLLERAERALPRTFTSAYFGTSEAGAVTLCPPDAPRQKRLGRDGRAVAGMSVAVVGGQLLLCGPQLGRGYWDDRWNSAFRPDGWYETGDEAELDDEGYVRLRTRANDRIIRGGENISPRELEEVLGSHPRVRDVAVVAVPDARLGSTVAAVVVARRRAPELDDLRRWCDDSGLAKPKWPERVLVVDALPRTATGKVDRALLAARLDDR